MLSGIVGIAGFSGTDIGPQFGALVHKSSGQSIGTTIAALSWDTKPYDTTGWHHSGNPERLAVVNDVSLVRVTSNVVGGVNGVLIQHFKNGAVVRGGGKADAAATAGSDYCNIASAPLAVSAGDYFDTGALVGSGNFSFTNDEETWMSIEKLDAALKYALVYNSASITLAAATDTIVNLNTEVADTDGFHSLVATVTITIASPGVVTWTGHNFLAGSPIVLTTTGALPTGLSANTIYYVVSPAANTFQLSATPGGAAINTSGTQSGTHTATNSSRLIVPAALDGRAVRLVANLAGGSVAGEFHAHINKNGSNAYGLPWRDSDTANEDNVNLVSAPVVVATGDYFELIARPENATTLPSAENVFLSIEEVPAAIKRALVRKTAAQTFLASDPDTISWDAEEYDTDAIHDTSSFTTRMTVPAGCTKARPCFSLRTTAVAQVAQAWVTKNGADYFGMPVYVTEGLSSDNLSAMGAWVDVIPGDYFELNFITNTGCDIGNSLSASWFCLECQ